MMKVYDMVTYGMHDPDEIAPTYGYETTQTTHQAASELQLQTVQATPQPRSQGMPASLITVDIDCFLNGIDE